MLKRALGRKLSNESLVGEPTLHTETQDIRNREKDAAEGRDTPVETRSEHGAGRHHANEADSREQPPSVVETRERRQMQMRQACKGEPAQHTRSRPCRRRHCQ